MAVLPIKARNLIFLFFLICCFILVVQAYIPISIVKYSLLYFIRGLSCGLLLIIYSKEILNQRLGLLMCSYIFNKVLFFIDTYTASPECAFALRKR